MNNDFENVILANQFLFEEVNRLKQQIIQIQTELLISEQRRIQLGDVQVKSDQTFKFVDSTVQTCLTFENKTIQTYQEYQVQEQLIQNKQDIVQHSPNMTSLQLTQFIPVAIQNQDQKPFNNSPKVQQNSVMNISFNPLPVSEPINQIKFPEPFQKSVPTYSEQQAQLIPQSIEIVPQLKTTAINIKQDQGDDTTPLPNERDIQLDTSINIQEYSDMSGHENNEQEYEEIIEEYDEQEQYEAIYEAQNSHEDYQEPYYDQNQVYMQQQFQDQQFQDNNEFQELQGNQENYEEQEEYDDNEMYQDQHMGDQGNLGGQDGF